MGVTTQGRLALACALLACWVAVAAAASVTMEWRAPTTGGPPAGYSIYRKVNSGAFELRGSVGATTLVYTDTAPMAGTNTYHVTAWNSGGESLPSNDVTFSLLQKPGPPGQLQIRP